MRPRHVVPLLALCILVLATNAAAQCSAPSQPGVRICAPSQNATTVYVPAIQVSSSPVSGSIHQFIIYDNGKELFRGYPYQFGVNLYDYSLRNGRHNVVVNAWDTDGHVLQSSVTFFVIGQGYGLICSTPSTPDINFCTPPADSIQSGWIPASATAKGYSKITAVQAWLDGKLQTTQQGYDYLSTSIFPALPGKHRVTMTAYDSTGHRFSATKYVRTAWGYVDCPPKGDTPCSPGLNVVTPTPDAHVERSLAVDVSVENNPKPITAMKVYLDSMQVAASSGPTLRQTISSGASGTHILTVQAWDTDGHLYRVQQNVNINMPH